MKCILSYICTASSARSADRGVTIIENLVAITLLGLVLASNSRLIISTMQSNQGSRTYAALVADAQQMVDDLRTNAYTQLLDKFSTTYSAITDGQTATQSSSSGDSRTTFQTTYTAIKTSNTANPEAVKVRIQATQRRGSLGTASYSFETVIAQLRS